MSKRLQVVAILEDVALSGLLDDPLDSMFPLFLCQPIQSNLLPSILQLFGVETWFSNERASVQSYSSKGLKVNFHFNVTVPSGTLQRDGIRGIFEKTSAQVWVTDRQLISKIMMRLLRCAKKQGKADWTNELGNLQLTWSGHKQLHLFFQKLCYVTKTKL